MTAFSIAFAGTQVCPACTGDSTPVTLLGILIVAALLLLSVLTLALARRSRENTRRNLQHPDRADASARTDTQPTSEGDDPDAQTPPQTPHRN